MLSLSLSSVQSPSVCQYMRKCRPGSPAFCHVMSIIAPHHCTIVLVLITTAAGARRGECDRVSPFTTFAVATTQEAAVLKYR